MPRTTNHLKTQEPPADIRKASSADLECTVAEAMKAELLTARMEYQQEIRERAYEIFCNRDSASGTDLDDWFKAEKEIAATKNKQTVDGFVSTVGAEG